MTLTIKASKPKRSNSAKGNYYKLRTKKWLEAKGYEVAFMERIMWIPPKRPGDRMIPVKRDQMGADLLAVSATEIIFVQVKLQGTINTVGRRSVAIAEFRQHVVPEFAQQWLVIWEPKAHEPEIHEVEKDTIQ